MQQVTIITHSWKHTWKITVNLLYIKRPVLTDSQNFLMFTLMPIELQDLSLDRHKMHMVKETQSQASLDDDHNIIPVGQIMM